MSSNVGTVPLPALFLLPLLLFPTRAVCIPAVGGATQDMSFQVFRILQNEKPDRNTSFHYCHSILLRYRHCKVQMQSTSEDQASHSGAPELETWFLTCILLCSGFPTTEMAMAAAILNTSRPLCYWCQAVFLMNGRPHPNVVLPLLSGCSKADVSGLPLSWCFWVLCCENLLENNVLLWKDWPFFKG